MTLFRYIILIIYYKIRNKISLSIENVNMGSKRGFLEPGLFLIIILMLLYVIGHKLLVKFLTTNKKHPRLQQTLYPSI